jgi:septum formation protein
MKRKIILASSSPRRKQLLEGIGLVFDVVESNFVETMDKTVSPETLTKRLSLGKAKAVSQKHPDAIIIAADTIIVLGNTVFGKPKTPENARKMLSRLQGKTHTVVTGFTVIDSSANKRK